MHSKYAPDSAGKSPVLSLNMAYFLLCFSVSLAGLWMADYRLITVDNAAILTMAKQMLGGRQLYSDLFTAQFPLIFYLSMPALFLHSLLGIPVPAAFFFYIFALLQLCVLFSWQIANSGPLGRSPAQRYALLLTFYVGLFVIPLTTNVSCYGQREHLFCAFILPYIMLCVNRLLGAETTRRTQIAVGVLAAIGLCIKPHFAVIFILAELFQMLALRRFFTWHRADAWTIVVLSACYYTVFLVFYPGYIPLIPRFVIDYSGYERPWPEIVAATIPLIVPPALFASFMRRKANMVLVRFLLTLIGGCAMLYVLPRLPYFYHAIPLYFFSLLLFVLGMLAAQRTFGTFVAIALFMFYIPLINAPPDMHIITSQHDETLADAALLAPYKTVASFNSEAGIQRVLMYTNAKWMMCVPYLEYLPAAYRPWRGTHAEPPYHAPADMDDNEHYFHEKIIKDLQQLPDAIIVDESPVKSWLSSLKFDYLHYFMKDPRFVEIWSHYELGNAHFTATRNLCTFD